MAILGEVESAPRHRRTVSWGLSSPGARYAVSPASGSAAASSHESRAGRASTFSRGTATSSAYVPFVGAWVVLGNVWETAKPWWRYASIASISFTVGAFYGRYRRDTKKPKKPA